MSKKKYKLDNTKRCFNCNKTIYRVGSSRKINDYTWSRTKFCSRKCSNEFYNVRKEFSYNESGGIKIPINKEYKCEICGFSDYVEIHHIIPKHKGGKNTLDNFLILCPNCHSLYHKKKFDFGKIISKYSWLREEYDKRINGIK